MSRYSLRLILVPKDPPSTQNVRPAANVELVSLDLEEANIPAAMQKIAEAAQVGLRTVMREDGTVN